jgi:hypothetical protein
LGCSRRPRAAGNPLGLAADWSRLRREGGVGSLGRIDNRSVAALRAAPSRLCLGVRSRLRRDGGGGTLGRLCFNRLVENRRWIVGPRGNRSLSAADAAFVRGSDHRWRHLRSRHRTRCRALRLSLMLMSRRVMEAPSKITDGLWGREGTAHSRRLTPPSFAAQNPPQFSSLLMSRRVMEARSKIAFGLWGREGTAHSRRLTPPSFAALTIAGGAFVRGTEPAAGRRDFH